MSDEPPPLRLKPRLKAENEPGAPAAETPEPAAPAGGEEGAPKVRLRPRLSGGSDPATPAAAPSEPAPPAAEMPRLKPRFSISAQPAEPAPEPPAESPPVPETAGGGDPPKFKLKFKVTGAAPEPPAEAAPEPLPETPAEIPAELPPEELADHEAVSGGDALVGAPAGDAAPARPKIVQLRLSEDQLPPLEPGEVKMPKPKVPKKAITAGVLGVLAAFLVVFGGYSYFTYRLRDLAPAPKPVVVAPVPKPIEPEVVVEKEPTETPEEIAAKKAAAAAKRRPPPPKAAAPVAPAASTTNLGGGMSATTSDDVAAATNASPEFRSWIAGAKIGGVFQGASPRVLINGRTVRAGTTVDEGLGIIFDSVNAANKTIIFKDATGAVVERHY